MLFVMQKKQLLFKLAHDYLAIDDSRPEVSCLIGIPHNFVLHGG
jgi:hypothetical protein